MESIEPRCLTRNSIANLLKIYDETNFYEVPYSTRNEIPDEVTCVTTLVT